MCLLFITFPFSFSPSSPDRVKQRYRDRLGVMDGSDDEEESGEESGDGEVATEATDAYIDEAEAYKMQRWNRQNDSEYLNEHSSQDDLL